MLARSTFNAGLLIHVTDTKANAGQAGLVAVAAGEGLVWVWC